MFFKRMTQKVNIFILVMSMFCLSGGVVYGQDVTSDIEGHWAQPTIDKWLSKGLSTGYSDDSFRSNNVTTRGEYNRQFEFNKEEGVHYTDLSALDWNYSEVQKMVKEGYIKGYKLSSDEKAALAFKNPSEFSLWSTGSAGAVFSENNIGWNVDFAENNTGTAQVVTLTIENGATAPGSYYVYFTDGGAPIPKTVSITGTETAKEVASKIAAAFGTSISGWSAAADGSKVLFTSQQPGTNNEHVRIYALEASGVGAPSGEVSLRTRSQQHLGQPFRIGLYLPMGRKWSSQPNFRQRIIVKLWQDFPG
ncbi:S-layer homology domain-containing protein [Paenibacillus sp. 2TAF8]|uniref:S-layer homology domain-containing protein n=1 Tax=Paenibacillus sp. 2TAF8 TaxID=3233020 RepID=UPI003F983A94